MPRRVLPDETGQFPAGVRLIVRDNLLHVAYGQVEGRR
jgi:hypothetical protein